MRITDSDEHGHVLRVTNPCMSDGSLLSPAGFDYLYMNLETYTQFIADGGAFDEATLMPMDGEILLTMMAQMAAFEDEDP